MPLGMIFWVLMLLWLVLGIYWYRGRWSVLGPGLIVWALVFIIGWRVFGFIVQ